MSKRLSFLFFALFATAIIFPSAAVAHAGLVTANPAANSSASFMPEEIKLTFTEPLMQIEGKSVNSISLSYMKHPDLGFGISLGEMKVDGSTLSATIPADQFETGKYVVSYTIVSADGHKLSDSYSFTLKSFGSTLQPATPAATPAPSDEDGNGVLPLPIAGAIVIVVILGGYLALRARNRKL